MGKRLGQHFLHNKEILAAIAREALSTGNRKPTTKNLIIEIGAGHGELTDALLAAGANKIIAIERDPALANGLRRKYGGERKIEVIGGDVREILPILFENWKPARPAGGLKIGNSNHAVVGNIPYYLTGYLFRLIGELISNYEFRVSKIVLLVQKEVAERACAVAPRANLLSLITRGWAEPEIEFAVPRRAFSPPPKVDSALLMLTPHEYVPRDMRTRYFEVVKKAFAHPRKTLANNLREGYALARERVERVVTDLGLPPEVRPSVLTPAHLTALARILYD